jgi:hypothetical protein
VKQDICDEFVIGDIDSVTLDQISVEDFWFDTKISTPAEPLGDFEFWILIEFFCQHPAFVRVEFLSASFDMEFFFLPGMRGSLAVEFGFVNSFHETLDLWPGEKLLVIYPVWEIESSSSWVHSDEKCFSNNETLRNLSTKEFKGSGGFFLGFSMVEDFDSSICHAADHVAFAVAVDLEKTRLAFDLTLFEQG